jgi:hypothetical protein
MWSTRNFSVANFQLRCYSQKFSCHVRFRQPTQFEVKHGINATSLSPVTVDVDSNRTRTSIGGSSKIPNGVNTDPTRSNATPPQVSIEVSSETDPINLQPHSHACHSPRLRASHDFSTYMAKGSSNANHPSELGRHSKY